MDDVTLHCGDCLEVLAEAPAGTVDLAFSIGETPCRMIPGMPGYCAGVDGSVWSSRGRWGRAPWHRLRPSRNSRNGYLYVAIHGLGPQKTRTVHQLVALAFFGPPPAGQEVRHKNGIRTDPSVENLCYGTPAENAADKILHGTNRQGEQIAHFARLEAVQVIEIREKWRLGASMSSLARKYGVWVGTIHAIAHRKTWKHLPEPAHRGSPGLEAPALP